MGEPLVQSFACLRSKGTNNTRPPPGVEREKRGVRVVWTRMVPKVPCG